MKKKKKIEAKEKDGWCTKILIDGKPLPETKDLLKWQTAHTLFKEELEKTGSKTDALIAGAMWTKCEHSGLPLFNTYGMELATYAKRPRHEKKKMAKAKK